MTRDPDTATARADLPFLRHRARPRPSVAVARPAEPAAAVTDFISGRAPRPSRHPSVPPPADVAPPSDSVGIQRNRSVDHGAVAVSSSLDLDEPAPAQTPAPRAPSVAPPAAPRPRAYPVARVQAGARTILTVKLPTVTLTRTQSGIGTLTFEAACSDAVGDLRLGCAYDLRSGGSSTVQSGGGNRFAPPRSRRPVIVGGRDRYARLSVDLRQCQDLERLVVFAYSEGRAQLNWGGTLITTTFGGAKIELPLEELSGTIAVLMSLYNVRGEFVLRAEMLPIAGSIREACRAFGFERITWLDDRTPVD